MRTAKNFRQNLLRIHFINPLIRTFSTQPDVYEFQLSPKSNAIIQEHNEGIEKYFSKNKKSWLKPFDLKASHQKSVEFAAKITDADPILKQELEHIHQSKPAVISIPQIPLSASIQHFPENSRDLNNPEFQKETRPSILTICCFAHLFGIRPTEPSFIFSQNIATAELSNTNKGLDWHNDGWQKYPDHMGVDANLMLLGIIGNKEVLTEVITLRKILETLREAGREDLIAKLSKDHFISFEDYLPVIAPIIKGKTIRFASRAANDLQQILSVSGHAALELKEHLDKITPSFTTSLEEGDLLLVKNYESLHRRSIVPETSIASNTEKQFQGQRLLTRIIGEAQK